MPITPEPELHKRQFAFTAWNQLPGAERKKWEYDFDKYLEEFVVPVKKDDDSEEGEAIVE